LYKISWDISLVSKVALLLIVVIAFWLRTINLTYNPPELFSDELINFVSARSIVETGKDLNGRLLPYFSDRVELRPPIYGYSAYLSTKLFGNTTIAIRLPAVIFGIITIIMLFQITLEITKSHIAALFAAFCLAIIPWHIHYSRVGWEPASFLPFLLTAIFLLIKGINKNLHWAILLGFGFFSLSIYTYQASPMFSFLFLVAVIGLNYRYFIIHRKVFFAGILIAAIIALPYIWTAISEPHLYERARRINTFSQGFTSETIRIFLRNYISHFGHQFLFISGDPNLRHSAQTGVLYWWMLPFILIGSILLYKSVKKRWCIGLLAFWVVIFPLAGSLTNDGVPHATRTLVGAPLFCLLTGIGIWQTIRFASIKTHSRLFVGFVHIAILVIALAFLALFLRKYFIVYPKESYAWWDSGHREIFTKVRSIESQHRRACLDNLNYWNELQLKDYYLKDCPLYIINNIDDPACRQSGSIIVVKANKNIFHEGYLFDTVYDLKNQPYYYIYTID
jgi:4-amino-4-deoxy-L-arabinose transferase-like glycosyltransferase